MDEDVLILVAVGAGLYLFSKGGSGSTQSHPSQYAPQPQPEVSASGGGGTNWGQLASTGVQIGEQIFGALSGSQDPTGNDPTGDPFETGTDGTSGEDGEYA
jgi:hypothetical protein